MTMTMTTTTTTTTIKTTMMMMMMIKTISHLQGHNMDDVLMSHVAWVMNQQMKRKHGFYNNVGESVC